LRKQGELKRKDSKQKLKEKLMKLEKNRTVEELEQQWENEEELNRGEGEHIPQGEITPEGVNTQLELSTEQVQEGNKISSSIRGLDRGTSHSSLGLLQLWI
jgi:hypothetical protein